MKQVLLLHNPSAGDEDHLAHDLVDTIQKEGYSCIYFSIKDGDNWREQLDQADFVAVAGGDGTVRGVVKELMSRTALDKKLPIAILPMGTANNLSKILGVASDTDRNKLIRSWKKNILQRFDVGVVKNAETRNFFLESTGFGVFPQLMQQMETINKSGIKSTQEEITLARKTLLEIVLQTKPNEYRIKTEDHVYEGKSLLIEVMNIPSIGPNLILCPQAQTDDSQFDIICIEDSQRESLANYLRQLIAGKEACFDYTSIRANQLSIDNDSKFMHIDDELTIPYKNPIVYEVREDVLEFMTLPKTRE